MATQLEVPASPPTSPPASPPGAAPNNGAGQAVESSVPAAPTGARRETYDPYASPYGGPEVGFSIIGTLFRYWWWTGICLVAASAAGWFLAKEYSKLTFQFEGRLLYVQNTSGAPDYIPPTLHALMPIVDSRAVLESVIQSNELDLSPLDIAEALEIEVPFESSILQVALSWPTEDGDVVLQATMDEFVRKVSDTRADMVGRLHERMTVRVDEIEDRLQDARERLTTFNREHNVLEIDQDLRQMRATLEGSLATLQKSRSTLAAREAQVQMLDDSSDASSGDVGKRNKGATAMAELQRRTILQGMLAEEQAAKQRVAAIEIARTEYESAKKLHEQQLVSRLDYEKARLALQALEETSSPTAQKVKQELTKMDERVPQAIGSSSLSTLMGGNSYDLSTQVALQVIESEQEVDHLENVVDATQTRVVELSAARQEGQFIAEEIRLLSNERERMEKRLTDFSNLKTRDSTEFSLLQPASEAIVPVRSNKKKLLAGGFAATFCLLMAPAVLWSNRRSRQPRNRRPR